MSTKQKILLVSSLGLALWSMTTFAAPSLQNVKKADKISIALTGLPMDESLRAEYLKGELTFDQLADTITKGPEFRDYLAQFWTRLLGIQQGVNPWNMKSFAKGNVVINLLPGTSGQDRIANVNDGWADATVDRIEKRISGAEASTNPHIIMKSCNVNGKIFGLLFWYRVFTREDNAKTAYEKGTMIAENGSVVPVRAGTAAAWKKMYEWLITGDDDCNNPANKIVKPWWDPTAKSNSNWFDGFRAAPAIYRICGGETLAKCNMHADYNKDRFTANLSKDIAGEAGYLIAQTVVDDRPWSEVLTTQDTMVTGTYGAFMSGLGNPLWSNFPNGGYASANSIFKTLNVEDRNYYRVARGKGHAGVLTTPIYHMVTNGRRAKANRAFEVFLCSKFVVPDGLNPDPNDANPDLTKRHYCDSCHKSLEPMAAYFNAWPTTGDLEYHYTSGQDERGSFNAQYGEGAEGYAAALISSPRFDTCSVQRAFEFLNGRKMTTVESINRTADYVKVLKDNGDSIRAVLKTMVTAPEFLDPK